MLFNYFISHRYLPRDFMKIAIVLIIKNKTETLVIKIFTHLYYISNVQHVQRYLNFIFWKLNNIYTPMIINSDLKSNILLIDMCIFTVKSVIKYHTKQKSDVYTCFIDAAKAVHRVIVTGLYLVHCLNETSHSLLSEFLIFVSNTTYMY